MGVSHTKLLKRLIFMRGAHCEFCGETVICVAMIRRRNRIEIDANHATFRSWDGRVVTELVATVEHIRRRVDGGRNTLDNVAVACAPCNQARNLAALPVRKVCGRCHGRFDERGGQWRQSRSCVECHKAALYSLAAGESDPRIHQMLSAMFGKVS